MGETDPRQTEALLQQVAAILARDPANTAEAAHFDALAALVREMASFGYHREDPTRETLALLGDKWSPLLLLLLNAGNFRHSSLQRLAGAIGSDEKISQRILTLHLRGLERDGLISRHVTPLVPPRVDYAITPLGAELAQQIRQLMRWAGTRDGAIRAARARFDARQEPE